jgi:oligoribonuclease (3'-5' exoribonuclease)
MMGQTSTYDSRLHKAATLMMLAAYLFFAFGDITIEVMHNGIHAWQNAKHTHQSHTHHHDLHAHGHSHGQHQHAVLEFLKRWVDVSSEENSAGDVVKVSIDKHFFEAEEFLLSNFTQTAFKQFFCFSSQLLAKHSWPAMHPPQIT